MISDRDPTLWYHGGNRESSEAHASIADSKHTLRRKVVAYVASLGETGATSDEIEVAMGLPHQTVSARLTEAKKYGELVKTDQRRPTRLGRMAAVLVAPIPDHECQTCGEPCQGGCLDYMSVHDQQRHGCADHKLCAKAWFKRRFAA